MSTSLNNWALRMVRSHPMKAAAHAMYYNGETRAAVRDALSREHRCMRCGRKLKTTESLRTGIGPECSQRRDVP